MKQLTKWMNGRRNTWDIRWQKEEEIKKRKKSKSDMIEWEIDETYTECGNERRMSGHMNKEMQRFFIYRNENRNYISLDRGCRESIRQRGISIVTTHFSGSNILRATKHTQPRHSSHLRKTWKHKECVQCLFANSLILFEATFFNFETFIKDKVANL